MTKEDKSYQEKEDSREFHFKDLSLVGKVLLPAGSFSLGLALGLNVQHIHGPDLIATGVMTFSFLGTNASIVYDKYKELKQVRENY